MTKIITLLLGLLLLLLALPAQIEAAPLPPCPQDNGPAGCIDVTLSPANLRGDIYVDGTAVGGQVNTLYFTVAPDAPHLIQVKNVTDGQAGFGDIFIYQEAGQTDVVVATGAARALTFRPQITYLKGQLAFECDVKAVEEGQSVACQPFFDGTPLPGVLPATPTTFALPVGEHTLHVDLVGPHAGLWDPPSADYPITITGGRTTAVDATFNRKGQLLISLALPNIFGDIYIDGVAVAGQVNSTIAFVAPGAHTVEVRAINDPAAAGIYRYQDASAQSWVSANQSRAVVLTPAKEFLMGFARLTCALPSVEVGQDVRCLVLVNGQGAAIIEAGQSQTLTLPSGAYTLTTQVIGQHADLWSPAAQDTLITIIGGRTQTLTPTFNRKGQLLISLTVPGIVGDILVDDVPVAGQANAMNVFVAPGVHTVKVQTIVDPAANGIYRYQDASMQTWVAANQSREVTVTPAKEFLMGFGLLTCKIPGIQSGQDIRCGVVIDGQDMGTVEAGQTYTYTLLPGAHTVNARLVGQNADLWIPAAQDLSLPITAGRTRTLTAAFSAKPAPKPAAPAVPAAPVYSSSGNFELGGHIMQGFQARDLIHYSGMNWVKVQVRYPHDAGGIISEAHANGFKIQLSALGDAEMTTHSGFERDISRWVAGMAAAGADAIEIWNEPNLPREWTEGTINPTSYTSLLCNAYIAIKGANPGTAVISAAPAPTGYFGGCHGGGCDDIPWLQGVYNAGGLNCMDYIGAHHNAGATAPGATTGHPADSGNHHHSWYFLPQTQAYYQIFRGARKLFYTELGYVSPEGYGPIPETFWWGGATTVAQQAQWLSEVVQLSQQTGMVRAVVVWNVDANCYGICGGVGDPQAGYAIIRPGGGCPACESLHALLGTR
ncbi:MAG: hypothetical protein RBT47_01865 [Anaerolineae bacterium]|jgi:hypothetical protein|nr:hypothetical protein [Anaerolineae bacterium]